MYYIIQILMCKLLGRHMKDKLCYTVRTSIKQYQPLHVYYTRLKNNNNLNVLLNKSNFGNQSPIIKGVLSLCKYNINVFSFIHFIQYKKTFS